MVLGCEARISYFDLNVVVVVYSFSVSVYYRLIFEKETPPGSRLNRGYNVKSQSLFGTDPKFFFFLRLGSVPKLLFS